MALIRPFTHEGIEYPAAYCRITSIRCDKTETYVYVCTYEDEAARLREDDPIFSEEHMTSTPALYGDLLVNAYAFVKTWPGYETATDHPVTDPAEVPNVPAASA